MMTAAPTRTGAITTALASLALVVVSGGSAPVHAGDLISPAGFVVATANTGQAREVAITPPKARPVRVKPAVRRQHVPSSSTGSPRAIGRALAARRGWTGSQWTCLNNLWTRESGWHVHDANSSSGAYGIPQALPGRKMASAGSDWRDNATTQIRWGLGYIAGRYGTPCGAWHHFQAHNYY
ncbi:MAG: resuscitation-promoting factor RpfB [Frankiales bacterium]|jgi:hypothetical protein|nr:resuscitation-promoting factor RpfB [Frankiales bacterium]